MEMRRAIVVGRSADTFAEYAGALELGSYDVTLVVGKTAEIFPDPIDHWVSFHANLFGKWAATRAANHLPPPARCWAALYKGHRMHDDDAVQPAPFSYVATVGGSSGFMAIQVALDKLGCDRVVLAGVPMTADAGHLAGASTEKELAGRWEEASRYWRTWEERMDWLQGRVRSMSGRTRDTLGAPTREWLAYGG